VQVTPLFEMIRSLFSKALPQACVMQGMSRALELVAVSSAMNKA
jgi:hypothetical protein